MACAGLASSGSSQVANPNSGCEEEQLRAAINQRKLRRMQSNRESARRSRLRKQKHVDDLVAQASQLRKEKSQILVALNVTVERYLVAEAENCMLSAQVAELSARLRLLGEMGKYCYCLTEAYMDGSACEEEAFLSSDCCVMSRPWSLTAANQISIAFPDDGAWKRFHKQLQHFPVIICNKVREGEQRIVCQVVQLHLVQSGGTLIECQKVLAAHGAEKISAYVTHGIFPNKSWERFKYDNEGGADKGLTYFCITDSCPLTVKEVKNRPPLEILSLSGQIASALQI